MLFYELLSVLVPLAIIGGVVYLIIYLNNRKKHPNPSPFDWRRLGVGAAMILIVPFFISFATSAVFNQLSSTVSFIAMLIAAIAFLVIGMIVAHNTVISISLIIGSIMEIIVAFGYNFESISPAVMTIVAGLGLAALIYFAYRKMQEQEGK